MAFFGRISSAFSPLSPLHQLRQRSAAAFSRRWVRVFSYLVIAIFLATAACATYSYTQRRVWRAVFLSNGQVYFGKFVPPLLWHFGTLTNIYYLQVNSKPLQPVAKTDAAVAATAQASAAGQPNANAQVQEQKSATPSTAQSANDTSRSSVLVVKLGDELHGPEDIMTIPASSILFWEDLRSDSEVVLTINRSLNGTSKK